MSDLTMADTTPPPSARRFTPTPIETTVKKVRRFAVEPVETTTRSSRREDAQKIEDSTTMENKVDVPTKRRFVPEPIETTHKTSKKTGNAIPTPEPTPVSIPELPSGQETPKPRRKFIPELIETCKRSKRAGDTQPATLPTDKVSSIFNALLKHSLIKLEWQTDLTPGVPNIYTKKKIPHTSHATTPNGSLSVPTHTQIPPQPPRRQGSMRPHLNTRRSTRQDSFRPELDDIESSQSEEEGKSGLSGVSTPSLSGSIGSSEDSQMRLQMSRTRESCDDRFSGYLLELAAKAAQKQLQEQALAAFPNESSYEIVEHFYDREIEGASDEGSVEGVGMLGNDEDQIPLEIRRKSTEVGWAAKEMQAHQEKLNRLREDETHKKIAAEASQPTFNDPFWTNGMTSKFAQPAEPRDRQKEAELDRMRSAASPPMLGGDLVFRFCPSPKATKFESDQKPDLHLKRCDDGGGLWGGYCVKEEADQYISPAIDRPTYLQTPHSEREDPCSAASSTMNGAKSPNGSKSTKGGPRMLVGLEERLQAEVARSKAEDARIAEFDDSFVTQVYNYLSLGYPALARQYDEELAKIARVSEEELRQEDSKRKAKGYLGIFETDTKDEPRCARWKALRVYILEWAKQHPSMSNGAAPQAWGVRARRGSWAI